MVIGEYRTTKCSVFRAMFSEIISPKNPPFSSSIRCFSSWALAIRNAFFSPSRSPHSVLLLYSKMHRLSVPFDSFSILYTVKSSTSSTNPTVIPHLHAHIIKLGFAAHVYVATALLHAYLSTSLKNASNLFDEMPHRNVVTWNTMITGYVRSGHLEDAQYTFDRMPVRDVASWSAMIAGYMNNGSRSRGLKVFQDMMVSGLSPDEVTVTPILSSCGDMGSAGLLLGKSIHSIIVKNGWEMNVEIGTVLVDMYARCGLLKYGLQIFGIMKERNVITWTSLICGSAQHGHSEKALGLFEIMQQMGVKPNEMTFTGVLSACAHTGLVEEGKKYFKLIQRYGLKPTIQHYGCIVDLLGKAGLLEQAYETIQSMDLEPNVIVWSSFLAACRMHKQFEMADRVISQVLKMVKPENDGGVYTLICDLYVLNDRWDDAEKMRQLMASQKTRKLRGSSSIKAGIS